MAKVSMVEREKKRAKACAALREEAAELKAIINDRSASEEDRWEAQQSLQKLPRNASPSRQQRPLSRDGPAPWGLSQVWSGPEQAREAAMRGDVPGLVMSSW